MEQVAGQDSLGLGLQELAPSRSRSLGRWDLALPYEALDLPADPGLRISIYSPEPDSPERQALDLLASWTGSTALQR
jgi:hypothetical protein